MASEEPFAVDLTHLKRRRKEDLPDAAGRADAIGDKHGFTGREGRRGGRKPSPRTGQVHAKVLPEVSREISVEARRRGVQQGVILEEAWALYLEHQRQEMLKTGLPLLEGVEHDRE